MPHLPMSDLSVPKLTRTASAQAVPGEPLATERFQNLKLALDRVQGQLQLNPASHKLRFEQACLFEQLGLGAEARMVYCHILEREPTHRGALVNLGNLSCAEGDLIQAGILYQQAVLAHPGHLPSRTNLGNLFFKTGQLIKAQEQFEAALRIQPEYRAAHAGLSFVLAARGEPERAAHHRAQAYAGRCVVTLPYRGQAQPVSVLLLLATTTGNVPTERYLSDQAFERILVATEFYDSSVALPPHQLVFNAVGEADSSDAAFAGVFAVLGNTKAPVINSPSAVQTTSRCAIAARLAGIPGIVTPKTALLDRSLLLRSDAAARLAEQGFSFPLLLRSPGFHGGDHFLRVDAAENLVSAVDALPGDRLLVIEYLDARGADGKCRKYRVMMVDGQLYPLHVAVSQNWKIHYFSAEMTNSPEHRAEDGAFLADMPGVLGAAAMTALRQVQKTLGLDYGGIDFGLNARGEILLFEANATMTVVAPDKDPRWEYRRPAVDSIYHAVRQMLLARARVSACGVPYGVA